MGAGFGAFGKLPALGDFIRIGLPVSLTGPWDDWMQTVLAHARNHLADRWTDCYLSAPIWRFTLAAGTLGAPGLVGVVMPSVDKVGRQYPLTLAAPFDGKNAGLVHFANRPTFEKLEEVALGVLEEDLDRDRLAAELAEVMLKLPETAGRDLSSARSIVFRDVSPEQAYAAAHVAEHHGTASLWSALLDNDERLMISQGLPDPVFATGLFDLAAMEWTSGLLDIVK